MTSGAAGTRRARWGPAGVAQGQLPVEGNGRQGCTVWDARAGWWALLQAALAPGRTCSGVAGPPRPPPGPPHPPAHQHAHTNTYTPTHTPPQVGNHSTITTQTPPLPPPPPTHGLLFLPGGTLCRCGCAPSRSWWGRCRTTSGTACPAGSASHHWKRVRQPGSNVAKSRPRGRLRRQICRRHATPTRPGALPALPHPTPPHPPAPTAIPAALRL